jgi:phospholipase C
MSLPARDTVPLTLLFAFAICYVLVGCGGSGFSPPVLPPGTGSSAPQTLTPIKHVIIVVGENHSFDNVFATYTPADPTQHVWNLLSQNIVDVKGNPAGNYAMVQQK